MTCRFICSPWLNIIADSTAVLSIARPILPLCAIREYSVSPITSAILLLCSNPRPLASWIRFVIRPNSWYLASPSAPSGRFNSARSLNCSVPLSSRL